MGCGDAHDVRCVGFIGWIVSDDGGGDADGKVCESFEGSVVVERKTIGMDGEVG